MYIFVLTRNPLVGFPSQVNPVELSKTHSVLSYEPTNLYTDVGVGVGVGVGVADGTGVGVAAGLGVGVGVAAGLGEGEGVAAGVGDGVGVSAAVPEPPPPQEASKKAIDKANNKALACLAVFRCLFFIDALLSLCSVDGEFKMNCMQKKNIN